MESLYLATTQIGGGESRGEGEAGENVYVCANMGENNASARRVVAVCLLVLCAEPRGECGHQFFLISFPNLERDLWSLMERLTTVSEIS